MLLYLINGVWFKTTSKQSKSQSKLEKLTLKEMHECYQNNSAKRKHNSENRREIMYLVSSTNDAGKIEYLHAKEWS